MKLQILKERNGMNEDMAQELVELVSQRQELARQIEQLEILKQKQKVDEQIEKLKEAMRTAVEDGTLKIGKQSVMIGEDELSILPKNGRMTIEVTDIDGLDEMYRTDKEVPEAVVLEDGSMYEKLNGTDYYALGETVMQKVANTDLIKNYVKLGADVPAGVVVRRSRPSVSIMLNGKTL